MALFAVPQRAGRDSDSTIAKKTKTKAKAPTTVSGGSGIAGLISTIKATVERHLGKFADETTLIRDEQTLHNYISHCIDNGVISIDTETTGLDPLQDTLVGICIYTPEEKTAYIPINHISYITGIKADNQLSVDVLHTEFQRVVNSKIDVIMFNAPFDIRFIRSGINVYLNCTWDCYLGARLLNENEGAGNNGLKKLHQKYVLKGVGDAFKFDDLFRGVTFDKVPITTGYLYAAHDAIITYELYLFQREYLGENAEKYGLQDVAWVFHNVEMPIVDVVANMEDNGIEFDTNYAQELSVKYSAKAEDIKADIYNIIDEYSADIERFKLGTHKELDNYKSGPTISTVTVSNSNVFDNPINIESPKQLSYLLYDVIGLDAGIDKKTKQPIRTTGEDILKTLNHPLCEKILEYRGVNKLLSTYIDKLPNCVNPKDGRIHCKFNQYGADTGRFSSNDPKILCVNWGRKIRLIQGRAIA